MFLFSIVVFPLFVLAGGVVGNGGDSVLCKVSNANALNGVYSLDYILGLWQINSNPGFLAEDLFTEANSYANNFKRLIPLLEETYPVVGNLLKTFYSKLFLADLSQDIVWKPSNNGLIDLKDEKIISLLPKNCLGPDMNPSLIQTVVRQQRNSQVVYNYDQKAVNALSEKPMQLSFLLFHEWLWSFTEDVSTIRDANLIFHARDWSMQSVDEQIRTLSKIGVFGFSLERTVRTKFIFENGNLRVFYDGQEVIPKGRDYNIQTNQSQNVAVYQFLSGEEYYMGIYEKYNENGDNLRPKFTLSQGEEVKENTYAKKSISYKVVLQKRLASSRTKLFNLNYISQ